MGPAIGAFLLLVATGLLGFALIEHVSMIDAVYMTVIAISTVGFREVKELTPATRLFTIVIIVGGVLTLGFSAAATVEYPVGGHLVTRFNERRRQQALASLSGHYILCGYGRVGTRTASELRWAGRDVVAVDPNREACERADGAGLLYINGASSSTAVRADKVTVLGSGAMAGRRIDELNVRANFGVAVMAVRRNDGFDLAPAPETVLHADDVLIVVGHPDDLQRFVNAGNTTPIQGQLDNPAAR